ncbi:MAG: hypothetical protein RLZZ562_3343 [Planctomycetota bacterium]
MRLLLVAPFLPDVRASHGGGNYLGALCQALGAKTELALAAQLRPEEERTLQVLGTSPFVRAWTVPAAPRPTGLARGLHQLRMLARWGIAGEPLVAAKFGTAAMRHAVRRAVAEFRPDAVLLELCQSAQFVRDLAGTPCVLTDHEAGVPANTRTGLGAFADRRDRKLWQRYVLRHYAAADVVQAVTKEDAAALSQLLGRTVSVREPAILVPTQPVSRTGTPPRMLFLGSYSHEPNERAATVLAQEILPLVRTRAPAAELWLAGPDCERVASLGNVPGVRIAGFRPDLASLFADVRIVVAPLYSGGGFRVKTLSALAHGVPVVTNALGARGATAPAPALTIAERNDDLANAAARLLLDERRCVEASALAHRWAKEHVSPSAVADAQLQRIEQLLAARAQTR